MNVAIVGSRKYKPLDNVGFFVRQLDQSITIVSGGARGVDYEAERAAIQTGKETLIFPVNAPDDATTQEYGIYAKERNSQIVNASDLVVAFWNGFSGGTADSIGKARVAGKPVRIFKPDVTSADMLTVAQEINALLEPKPDTKTTVVHCKREEYQVYIGRPSKWGNPFKLQEGETRGATLGRYREWLMLPQQAKLRADARRELRGKVLGCWCKPESCHGDILAEVADSEEEEKVELPEVQIYVDGAAEPNPGKGGWGAVLLYGDAKKEIYGGIRYATNNEMEIRAAIAGLKALKKPCKVTIYSDSQYVVNTMEKGWNRNKNLHLWEELDEVAEQHEVRFEWVRGHNGNQNNELAHDLSMRGISELRF